MSEIQIQQIQNKIFTIRGVQVMVDSDLAMLYGVETKVLNQAVKRNFERFPSDFMFQLSKDEWDDISVSISNTKTDFLRSQNVTLNNDRGKHRKFLPYVFSEQGVSMLSAMLKSSIAVEISIKIIRAFVEMRKILTSHAFLFQRLETIETTQRVFQIQSDEKFERIFNALENQNVPKKQGLFFEGQIFDSYRLVSDIVRTAEKSIILIDNYTDDTVLTLFSKRKVGVKTTIYSKGISAALKQDITKFNSQYETIDIKELHTSHDRFLIIDEKTIYHFGASLKDLGKKWFAFSKLDLDAKDILDKL